MTENNKQDLVTEFNFAAYKITFNVLPSHDCDMNEFKTLVRAFQKNFDDVKITLAEEVYTNKTFAFTIESDRYIEFDTLRKIVDFLEKTTVIENTNEYKLAD